MTHKGQTECLPEEAGYNPDTLENFDKHILACMDEGITQGGIYMLSRKGKIFAHRSMGKFRDDSAPSTLMPDSIRPIASITKSITAVAILQLIEQGYCCLATPAAEIIDEFDTDMHRYITIFHLLTHTSGIRADGGAYLEPYVDYDNSEWTKENWIKKSLSGPLEAKPGERWSYCSAGFCILAEIVSRLSNMDFDDYVSKYILEPLEMTSSFFFCPDHLKNRVSVVDSPWSERLLTSTKKDIPTTSFLGSGGLCCSVKDLHQFALMLLNKGSFNGKNILSRKSVETATRSQLKNVPCYNWSPHIYDNSFDMDFGLGCQLHKNPFISPSTYSHEGAEGALMYIDPEEDFIFTAFFPDRKYQPKTWENSLAIVWSGII
ncbi:MAG: beta-lactamase family protein [Spirochaetales bacterium]|nr:beta-lactamase family protein [Spirochaetales bacterium]